MDHLIIHFVGYRSRYSQKEKRLPYYESVFLVRADVSSQQVEALAKSFTDIIADNDGSVTKTEHWGLRTLAYRIKKNRKAHYVLFNIDSPAAAVREMERNMRLNEDVLRHLTLRVTQLEEGPSAMMRAKAGRDDHGRRDRDRSGHHEAPPAASGASDDAAQPADDKREPETADSPKADVVEEGAAR